MSRQIPAAVAGLLATGALVAPVAHAAPPTLDELKKQLDSIPDSTTVPGGPPSATDTTPDSGPAPGEPPDPQGGDEDPFATPTASAVATENAAPGSGGDGRSAGRLGDARGYLTALNKWIKSKGCGLDDRCA